jgi:glycosyltransferase involved in cell wall biosynthesis
LHRSAIDRWLLKATRTKRDWEVKLRHLRQRPEGFDYFSTGLLRRATPWPHQSLYGDVLVLHWIGKLFDYPSFFASLPRERPIVWVLHDMNPFTGGCHFSAGCNGFRHRCGNCPQIAGSADDDITAKTLQMKQQLYAGLNLHVVSPSQWLSDEAKRSVAFAEAAGHHVIPYSLDTNQFSPVDRIAARRALNLDPDKKIVLFGAAAISNRRKGLHELLEAWAHLPADSVQGLMFGSGEAPAIPEGQAPIRQLGFIGEPEQLRLIYSAADLFVLPSLEDNLPQTGLEAMSCGTPVVAFDAGGIPDYVRPGQTGLLSPVGDAKSLAAQIRVLLDHPEWSRRMGRTAREVMVGEYSQAVESARYAELLGSILGRPVPDKGHTVPDKGHTVPDKGHTVPDKGSVSIGRPLEKAGRRSIGGGLSRSTRAGDGDASRPRGKARRIRLPEIVMVDFPRNIDPASRSRSTGAAAIPDRWSRRNWTQGDKVRGSAESVQLPIISMPSSPTQSSLEPRPNRT